MSMRLAAILTLVMLCLSVGLTVTNRTQASAGAQMSDKDDKDKKKDKSDKKNKDDKDKTNKEGDKDKGNKDKAEDDPNAGRAVLWEEPTDIESRDLYYGQGGAEGAPNPSAKYTFLRRSSGGTSEKIIVKGEDGREWTVKFGAEVRPETTATRIVWAMGYHVDEAYYMKEAHVLGRGDFDVWDVRFELRDDYKELTTWSWRENRFAGTRELNGLRTLMAFLNNWDLKTENNNIIRPNKESGKDRMLRIYYVSDLGGTLGATGNPLRKVPLLEDLPAGSKGSPNAYANQIFIKGVENGQVVFNYKGKNGDALKGIPIDHARWMGNQLARLSDKQLQDAFRAGNFTEQETSIFIRAMRDRIKQLQNLK
jgi:hypothetical protein